MGQNADVNRLQGVGVGATIRGLSVCRPPFARATRTLVCLILTQSLTPQGALLHRGTEGLWRADTASLDEHRDAAGVSKADGSDGHRQGNDGRRWAKGSDAAGLLWAAMGGGDEMAASGWQRTVLSSQTNLVRAWLTVVGTPTAAAEEEVQRS